MFVSKEKSITFASPLEKDASIQERFVSKQHIVISPCLCEFAMLNCGRLGSSKDINAEIAQLVEHNLAKVGVASSSLVFRSCQDAQVAEW